MPEAPPRIALTPGEPAGIGPDLCIALAQTPQAAELIAVGDPAVLERRARLLNLPLALYEPDGPVPAGPGRLGIVPVPAKRAAEPGRLDPANAEYVLETLRRAVAGCQSGEFAALLTGPVHKGVINEAGIPFTGHTEFLAELTGTPQVVMMLTAPGLRVALATTHLPLSEVSAAITPARLRAVLEVLHTDLVRRFALPEPRIAVCGLNPHAGEGGHLGREEIEVIEPVLEGLRAEGMQLTGPLPADTAFTPRQLAAADAVLAMYHDQGLPTLKHAGFGQAVNITLGMPIIRTSVDHGTALDLAGTGRAEVGSMASALEAALTLARNSADA